MRLKQLLGVLLTLLVIGNMAAAAVSQLTELSVAAQGNTTTVTLQANGTFTHNEYRPAENLLLVDLAGVAAGKLSGQSRELHAPGVTSYRVLAYQGAGGTEVSRLELMLAPGVSVNVSELKDSALAVHIAAASNDAVVASSAVPTKADAPIGGRSASPTRGTPATVRNIAVVRGKEGVEIEISANAPITPKAMKLAAPDRVVLDLLNTVPIPKSRAISVNSADVKSVRMARYQMHPPVTRVVVDLVAARNYEIVPSVNKLTVKIMSPIVSAATASAPAENKPAPTITTAKADAGTASKSDPQEFVVIQPEYHAAEAVKPAAKTETDALPAVSAKIEAPISKPEAPLAGSMVPTPSASLRHAAINLAMQQQAAPAAPPAANRPRYTGEPISVNLKDVDLKDFFRLIHEISGLNVVLDPNVRGTLTIVLDDVPWDQALDIVLQNNGLDKQLEGNVLRIATVDAFRREADARRAQAEAQALAVDKVTYTHYLSYAHSKDVNPIVKRFLSARGDVISDDRTNALIIQDIPSVIPGVKVLLTQLDTKTQEVEIEARVVAASRNFARDIGTQLGFGWGNGVSATGGGLAPTPSTLVIGTGAIPLFTNMPAIGPTSALGFVNATANYRLDLFLTMAETRGLLKILSRPRVITQNNIGANIRQGVKIPVVTAAQLGGPPTTTYIDAFLRLSVTPQITAENTIFLNVDVENTVPDFGREIAGNPALNTQQAQTQVLVTDGGTVVIGGVIQTQNSVNIQQVPVLGNIPVLGNLFKRRAVSTATNELIFFITPRIIQT